MKINKLVEHIIHHEAEYDEEGREITPAYDESVWQAENVEMSEEEIVQITPSEEEAKFFELESLHQFLNDTDYVTCKIAEGSATIEEYADIIAQRQSARARINELEA